jgi:uncharacterized membrane protein YuzA (DUF378 family)
MTQKTPLDYIAFSLILLGALHATILGLFKFDIVGLLVQTVNVPILGDIIFILIGLSAFTYIIRNEQLSNSFVYRD